MFGLFKSKTEEQKLRERYEKLMAESYTLSHTNRKASDQKVAEADSVMKQLELLKQKQN
ncbi:Lacal_2735 family protein [Cesiribacter sp. SM1]|uniref:Lacal_2735 family protein n=1 Tax=Cesiribacter sp. SM1 TaxID=2861196 RepID=UPI001CD4194C|nr:Lacal_2735 family protein [Cesiribacter sp. SM1]